MEQGTPITPPPAAGVAEDKTVAILAYSGAEAEKDAKTAAVRLIGRCFWLK